MMRVAKIGTAAIRAIGRFFTDRRGASAIEYGLLAGGIAVAISATIFSLGTEIQTNFYNKLTNLF